MEVLEVRQLSQGASRARGMSTGEVGCPWSRPPTLGSVGHAFRSVGPGDHLLGDAVVWAGFRSPVLQMGHGRLLLKAEM